MCARKLLSFICAFSGGSELKFDCFSPCAADPWLISTTSQVVYSQGYSPVHAFVKLRFWLTVYVRSLSPYVVLRIFVFSSYVVVWSKDYWYMHVCVFSLKMQTTVVSMVAEALRHASHQNSTWWDALSSVPRRFWPYSLYVQMFIGYNYYRPTLF